MPSSRTVLPHAPADVDLERWLYSMSDNDYQRASRQHRALGTFTENGVRGMVNVEVMGHALIVQHYAEITASPSHVQLYSAASRVYLLHVYPVSVGVRWTMTITPTEEGHSTFTCTVDLEMSPILRVLARLTGVTSAVRRHTREETIGFAADIARKLGGSSPVPGTP